MLLISPIVSAFDHCSGMSLSRHLSENQGLTVIMSTDDASPLKHKKMFKGQQSNQTHIHCHTSSDCSLHACGGYGMASSAPVVKTVISSYYSNYEGTSLYSTALPLDIRPPILIL